MNTERFKEITIEPSKRGGKPCIRGMRITVEDILGYLKNGMSKEEILNDFPELTLADIQACLDYSKDQMENELDLPSAEESFRQGMKEALKGETFPIETLWDDLDD